MWQLTFAGFVEQVNMIVATAVAVVSDMDDFLWSLRCYFRWVLISRGKPCLNFVEFHEGKSCRPPLEGGPCGQVTLFWV